jgi:hypothetical protein
MTLAEQRFVRSDHMVRDVGYRALIQALGVADTLRFVEQLSSGQGDYMEWQDQVFGDASVDDIYEQAETYWKEKDSVPPTDQDGQA